MISVTDVIKTINDSVRLVESDGRIYIAKVISLDSVELYKKLISLNNPNIVRFYKTELVGDEFCVLCEYINGQTLEDYVHTNSPLSDEAALALILQICNGLEAIHNLGLVHRDINPHNIMIADDGTAKIIDFGISRTVKANQGRDTEILGTVGFTAPEQFGFKQTDCRADIYSVGVLLNYLKTGALPTEKQAEGRIGDIVAKCTQTDATRRYAGVDELVVDITEKGRVRRFIQKIPGFRQGKWWHIAISCTYYFCFFILVAAAIGAATSVGLGVCYVGFLIFAFGLPVPILTDFNFWSDKLPFLMNKSKSTKTVLKLVFAAVSVFISIAFILLSPDS